MGFLDSLGKTVKSIGGAALAGPGIVYDMATALTPFNEPGSPENGNFGDLLNSLAGRGKQMLDPFSNDSTFTGKAFGETMHGLNWTYHEGVDQPLSSAMIMASHLDPGAGGNHYGDIFSGEAWSKAYDIAEHQSFGQSVTDAVSSSEDPFTRTKSQTVTDKSGKQTTVDLTPFQTNEWVQNHQLIARATALTADLGVSWFLDPGVLVGKGAGILHTELGLAKLHPADRGDFGSILTREVSGGRPKRFAGRIDDYFTFINGENRTGKALSGAEIYQITPELQRSARGKAIAGLLGDALKIEDVAQRENAARRIFAVSAGDIGQIDRLSAEIPGTQAIADALHNITAQKTVDLVDQALTSAAKTNPAFRAAYQKQLDNLDDGGSIRKFVDDWKSQTDAKLNADKVLSEARGTLDFVPGAHLKTPGRLRAAQGDAVLDKVAKTHDEVIDGARRLANRDSYSTVFQKSLAHVPLIVVKPIGWGVGATTKAPRAIIRGLQTNQYRAVGNLHDWETTSDQLNAMMHLAGVDDIVRHAELSKAYMALSEMDRKRAISRVEQVSMKGLAAKLSEKHGLHIDPDYIQAAMLDGQMNRQAAMAGMEGGRAYAATKNINTDLRIDQFADESGAAISVPVLSTQGANDIPMLDVNFAKRVTSDRAMVERLAAHSDTWRDTALEMTGLKGALARAAAVGDKSATRRLQSAILNKRKVQNALLDAASTSQRWWKLSVLFRLGYPQRVVADDHMRIGAHLGYGTFMAANLSEASKNIAYNLFGRRREATANYKVLMAQRAQLKDQLGRNGLGGSGFTEDHLKELKTVTKAYLAKGTKADARTAAETRMRELDPDGYYAEYADAAHAASLAAGDVRRIRKGVENGTATAGELEAASARWQTLADYAAGIDNPEQRFKELSQIDRLLDAGKKLPEKKHVGEADVALGDGISAQGVYGHSGGGYRAAAGSTIKDDLLFTQAEEAGVRLASTGNHRVIAATDGVGAATPGHLEVWANVLNHQFLSSPEMMAFVKGKVSTVDEFVKWVRLPANRHLLDRMEQYAHDPEGWGSRIQQMFHDYVPNEKLRLKLADGRVSAKELNKMFPEPRSRPDVHGQLTDIQTGRFGPTRYMSATVQRMFRYLADVPTDTLSRHPFMNAVYKREIKDAYQVRSAYRAKTGGMFTPEDLRQIEYTARNKALKELKRTLWDVSAHSHAAETMKFVSPFFAAHQEALNRWWRIASDDPSVVRHFQLAFDAPRKAGLTYNADTGEVYAGDEIGNGNRILLRLPGATRGMFKWTKALGGSEDWSVNEQGLNLILQNGVANPGVGPLVSIPLETLVQKYADQPNLLAAARVLNQYPPQASGFVGIATQSMMPAWMRNATALLNKDGAIYGRLYMQNYTDALIEYQKSHPGEPMTDAIHDELTKDAGHHTNMDLLLMTGSNLLAFTPMKPESKYAVVQHGLQKIQEHARQNGEDQDWAREQFKAQYGDIYLPMIYSLGNNPGRLDQNAGEVSAMKHHRGLLNNIDVSLTRMVIGPEAAMDAEADPDLGMYSDAARNYLKGQETQPGSGETYLGSRSRQEVSLKVLINEGWEKYDQLTNALDVMAAQQGLDSYEQSDQLVAAKRAGLSYIKSENFAFRDDFDSFSRGGFDKKLDDMKQIASNPKLLNDPLRSDVKLLGQYLQMRTYFTGLLSQRAAQGGASTMAAQANLDLQRAYAAGVNYLTQQNTYFKKYAYLGAIEMDPYLTGAAVDGQ